MKKNTHISSDGSEWNVWHDCPPIPAQSFDWNGTHVDYDGDGDHRQFYGKTREELIKKIDAFVWEKTA